MIYPDRNEGNTPIVTELFPLKPRSYYTAVRDIIDLDRMIGERSILAMDNELLLLYLEGMGINKNPSLMPFYQRGMLLSHRALRAEASGRGGILTPFDNQLLSDYIDSFVDINKEKFLARCFAYYQRQLRLPYEQAVDMLNKKCPQTISDVKTAYETHSKASQEAFKKHEQPFNQAIAEKIRGSTEMEQDAIFQGASETWSAFRFLTQRKAA